MTDDRRLSILNVPKPITKRQLMRFLGAANWLRSYISHYALKTCLLQKLIYAFPMTPLDHIIWTTEAEMQFTQLKNELAASPCLAIPDYSRDFIQTVDCRVCESESYMSSVVLQTLGTHLRPVAYYSQRLDAVASAMPMCVRHVVAAAMAVKASSTLVLFHPTRLLVTHAVSLLLLEQKLSFMSPARHLSCMAILLSSPHITIERCTGVNPATLLPLPCEGTPHQCDCVSEVAKNTLPRPDLRSEPLSDADVTYFVDGTCSLDSLGQRRSGYAIVTADCVVEAKRLAPEFSSQASEIVALTRACKLAEGRKATIHTDSQYAFNALHVFAAQWKLRNFTTTTGAKIAHHKLILDLLDAVLLPKAIAVCKCAAHTYSKDFVSLGNAFADLTAKQVAQSPFEESLLLNVSVLPSKVDSLDGAVLLQSQQGAPTREQLKWVRLGCQFDRAGYRRSTAAPYLPFLPRTLFHPIALLLHGPGHVSSKGMRRTILKHFVAPGISYFLQLFCTRCLI